MTEESKISEGDTCRDALETLFALNLIDATQKDQAQQNGKIEEALADNSPPAVLLAWMVVQGVVSEEVFQSTAKDLWLKYSGDELKVRKDVVNSAQETLREMKFAINRHTLKTLLQARLIDEVQFERIADALPDDEVLASPAASMLWIIQNELLSAEEYQALRSAGAAELEAPVAEQRAEILAELDRLQYAVHKAATKLVLRQIFPGGPWLWAAGGLLFLGWIGWAVFNPKEVPACDSQEIRKTVGSMLFRAGVQARSDFLVGRQNLPAGTPELQAPTEVGYLKAEKTRACMGTIVLAESKKPFAYTITPSGEENGEYIIAGASEALVQARFGHLDAEGKTPNTAEPIGRASLEAAIRAGVDAFNQNPANRNANRILERTQRYRLQRSSDNPDRDREVADLEPLGSCRALDGGIRYACNVLIERNDPLLAAVGQRSLTIVKAEFSLERNATGDGWQVSPDFANEYVKAIVHSRVDSVTGADTE